MKKTFKLVLLFSIISIGFGGCKKEKEEEAIADFSYTTIPNGGIEVTFTGKGTATWDFGGQGAQVGVGNTLKFYYKTNGSYTINLTAKSNSGSKTNNTNKTISITGVPSQVKITYVKLNAFRNTNDAGNPWDNDGTGPDIKFVYFQSALEDLTSIYPNLEQSELPISVTLSSPKVMSTSVGYFDIYCMDDNYSSEAIESLKFVMGNSTAQANCSGSCSQEIYPTKYSSLNNNYTNLEIGLEWLP